MQAVEPINTQAEAYQGSTPRSKPKNEHASPFNSPNPPTPEIENFTSSEVYAVSPGQQQYGTSPKESPLESMIPTLKDNRIAVMNSSQNSSRVLDPTEFRSENNNSSLIRNIASKTL